MEHFNRKTNRLGYYDYSAPGAYFVTICTQHHKCTLASILHPSVGDGFPVPSEGHPTSVGDGSPVPSQVHILKMPGKIVQRYILEIPRKYPNVSVDHYVVTPNHIHLLLSFREVRRTGAAPGHGTGNPSPTLGNVIGWLKYQVTREVNLAGGTTGQKFFQRSYHDHIIRNEKDYLRIWTYIDGNPGRWREDCFYTDDTRGGDSAVPQKCEEYQ